MLLFLSGVMVDHELNLKQLIKEYYKGINTSIDLPLLLLCKRSFLCSTTLSNRCGIGPEKNLGRANCVDILLAVYFEIHIGDHQYKDPFYQFCKFFRKLWGIHRLFCSVVTPT